MLAAYLDESYDDHVYAVAGYLIRSDCRGTFQAGWKRVCEDHRVPGLHMKELVSLHGKLSPREGRPHVWLFGDAIAMLRSYALCGFAVAVDRSEFHAIVSGSPGSVKIGFQRGPKTISPFAILFGACVHVACCWATQNGYTDEEISVTLDRGGGYGQHALAVFNGMKFYQWKTRYELGTLRFGDDSKEMALQAADMLAYEARKEFDRRLGKNPRPVCGLLNAILGSRVPHWCAQLSPLFLRFVAGGITPIDLFHDLNPRW